MNDVHRQQEIEGLGKALFVLRRIHQRTRQLVPECVVRHPPERPLSVRQLIDDPTGHCYQSGIREIGERLHKLGGADLMQRVANFVDPDWSAQEWDGIGGWWA